MLGQSASATSALRLERAGLAPAPAGVGGDQTLASASLMRSRRASAEKPPNTTEWAAPMRVQASMATTTSGTIGM